MRNGFGTVVMWSLLSMCVFASDKNPADYPLTAHILGTAQVNTGGGRTSSYNAQTGQWSHGRYSGSSHQETELRIGNIVYTMRRACKEVEVGKDYPAKIDKRNIHVLRPDGKTCDGYIISTHEAP